MVPFFTFYSMFGFQRVGDLIWSAADSRARGFLMGGTAGRTTLLGEGLQHQDGHSLLQASIVPVCQVVRPGVRIRARRDRRDGLRRMYGDNEDIFYYITLYNEAYAHPPKPDGIDDGIVKGMYRWDRAPDGKDHKVGILFSGSAHAAARAAQRLWPTTTTSVPSCGASRHTSRCGKRLSRRSGGIDSTPTRARVSRT